MSGIEGAHRSLAEWERVGARSHVTGLGLEGLNAKLVGDRLSRRIDPEEAAAIVAQLVEHGKLAARVDPMAYQSMGRVE